MATMQDIDMDDLLDYGQPEGTAGDARATPLDPAPAAGASASAGGSYILSTAQLRAIKNKVIGNPPAKTELALSDPVTLRAILNTMNQYEAESEAIIEGAHILASLSLASPEAVIHLLQLEALQLLCQKLMIATLHSGPAALQSALARALNSLAAAAVFLSGPREDYLGPPPLRSEDIHLANLKVDALFDESQLNFLLPLISPPSTSSTSTNPTPPAVQAAITSLFTNLLSSPSAKKHRQALLNWAPPDHHHHGHTSSSSAAAAGSSPVRPRRGWESSSIGTGGGGGHGPGMGGGVGGPAAGVGMVGASRPWVVRPLVKALRKGNVNDRAIALQALAALVVGQFPLVQSLCATSIDDEDHAPPVSTIQTLCKSRHASIQLAACKCVASMMRATRESIAHSAPLLPPLSSTLPKALAEPPWTLVRVLNSVIGNPDAGTEARGRACFILAHLVADNQDLEDIAALGGSIRSISELLIELVPNPEQPWMGEEEGKGRTALLEAALVAAASLTLCVEDHRNLFLTPNVQPAPVPSTINPLDFSHMPHTEPVSSLPPQPTTPTLPIILHALTHPEAGVRHGAAMCLRSLTRSMSVMHTTVGDSAAVGLLLNMLVFHDTSGAGDAGESGEDDGTGIAEDKRVIVMVLKALANLSNNYAPTQLQIISSPAFQHIRALVRISEEEDPTGSILQYATRNAKKWAREALKAFEMSGNDSL
ncbi:hypothetical protein DL93DRAFT_2091271 [Clavulina sp. PMI_390]|nr:hypothetical protein DL93DRAFT_2091271 [Clavulina sp. PMI_390]